MRSCHLVLMNKRKCYDDDDDTCVYVHVMYIYRNIDFIVHVCLCEGMQQGKIGGSMVVV